MNISKKLIKEIILRYNNGESSEKLSKSINISSTTIRKILKNNGIKLNKFKNVLINKKDDIINLYQSGMPSTKLAQIYNVSKTAILSILRKYNIKRRKSGYVKYKLKDKYYFDVIDTAEKAYILGFLYADGNNHKTTIKLALNDTDKEILEKINNLIYTNRPLKIYKPSNKTFKCNGNICEFSIHNKNICQILAKHGMVPNKTFKLKFPKWLSEKLIPHFIRGYFDGDGSVSIYRLNNKSNSINSCIDIVSTNNFCVYLKKLIKNKLNVNSYLKTRHKKRKTNTRQLNINGNKQVLTFLSWIYKNSTIHMERKYKKYLELIEILHKIYNKPKRYCKLKKCNEIHYGKGYCWKHWYQIRKLAA